MPFWNQMQEKSSAISLNNFALFFLKTLSNQHSSKLEPQIKYTDTPGRRINKTNTSHYSN